jgi:hypothetical protein
MRSVAIYVYLKYASLNEISELASRHGSAKVLAYTVIVEIENRLTDTRWSSDTLSADVEALRRIIRSTLPLTQLSLP